MRRALVLSLFAVAATAVAQHAHFVDSVLDVTEQLNPRLDKKACRAQFDALAEGLIARLKAELPTEADQTLAIVARYIFETNGFASKDTAPFDVYRGFDELLAKEQWNCLGMSVLYVALGEAVDLPFSLVAGPHHALVMYDDGETVRYIETTQNGRIYENLDYLDGYLGGAFPCVGPTQFAALGENATLAMLLVQSAAATFPDSRISEAKPHFEKAVALDPQNAEAHYALGLAEFHANRIPESISQFQTAIERDPLLLGAYLALGNAYRALNDRDKAIEVLQAAIRVCGEYAEAHFNLGILLHEQGSLREAAHAVQRAAELSPTDANALYVLATWYEEMGSPNDALSAYLTAVRVRPDFTEAWINAGALHQDAGNIEAALNAYQRAMNLEPENIIALLNFGDLVLVQSRIDVAENAYNRVLRIEPENVDAMAGLAHALALRAESATDPALRGKYHREAENLLDGAIEIAPLTPELRLDLAKLHLAEGRRETAATGYEKYLALGGARDLDVEKALEAIAPPVIRSDSPPTPAVPE